MGESPHFGVGNPYFFHDILSSEGPCSPDKPAQAMRSPLRFKPLKAEHASSSANREWEVRSAAIGATLRGQESLTGVPFEGL